MILFLLVAERIWAQIRIVSPVSLAKQFVGPPEGSVIGSTATFGAPYYGERVLGRVIYRNALDEEHPHCHVNGFQDSDSLTKENNEEIDQNQSGESHVRHDPKRILLVKRGGCSFVTKVKLAQKKFGAHAVIVIDKPDSPLTAQTILTIIMADDGYGGDITIPSILISHEDGAKLVAAINDAPQSEVLMELEWDVPANDIVIMDMWMSSSSKIANQFMKEFKVIGEALLYNLQFIPHYYIYELNGDFNNFCYSDAKHRYCADDPDMEGPLTGKDVVTEDLRQICVWEVTAEGRDDTDKVKIETKPMTQKEVLRSQEYWEYTDKILDYCPLDGSLAEDARFGSKVCAEKLMSSLSIPLDKVNYCMEHMGPQLLEHQLNNMAWAPLAIRINGWRYAGNLEKDLVTKAICSGFTKPPEICSTIMKSSVSIYTREWTWKQVVYVSLLTLSILTCLLYLYSKKFFHRYFRRALQEEVMLEVQNAMADYKMLLEDDGFQQEGNGRDVNGRDANRIGRLPRWN
eukprot:GEMP01007693.1.p1 GENE.GEMP01007693.1~~GEMP01007693.1.p1  ORF type:complete len:516 (+),score=80.06 GEMP01007693.1:331-1878(+)